MFGILQALPYQIPERNWSVEEEMNLLIKSNNDLLVELTEDEAKLFCEQFLKHVELLRGQDAVDKVVKHYLGGEQQPPYELMLQ